MSRPKVLLSTVEVLLPLVARDAERSQVPEFIGTSEHYGDNVVAVQDALPLLADHALPPVAPIRLVTQVLPLWSAGSREPTTVVDPAAPQVGASAFIGSADFSSRFKGDGRHLFAAVPGWSTRLYAFVRRHLTDMRGAKSLSCLGAGFAASCRGLRRVWALSMPDKSPSVVSVDVPPRAPLGVERDHRFSASASALNRSLIFHRVSLSLAADTYSWVASATF